MALAMELGWLWGRRELARGIEEDRALDGLNTAVFGLLTLLLAFSFSARQAHYELRRHLIVEEGNAIGTAFLRLDLLERADRAALRASFRRYVEARARIYQNAGDLSAAAAAAERSEAVSAGIWREAVRACSRVPHPACQVILPSINAVIDIGAMRLEAARAQLPRPVLLLLLSMAPISSLLLGVMAASRGTRSAAHALLYIGIITLTLMTILDLDNPRTGLITLAQPQERMAEQLRRGMADD